MGQSDQAPSSLTVGLFPTPSSQPVNNFAWAGGQREIYRTYYANIQVGLLNLLSPDLTSPYSAPCRPHSWTKKEGKRKEGEITKERGRGG